MEIEEEEEVQNYLFNLAIKIQGGDFSEKPNYIPILDQRILDPQIRIMLSKISNITKYTLVSPAHILYKQQHEKSKEKDKCSICLYEIYEEELNNYEKNPDNVDILLNIPFNALLLEKCVDHFFHVELLKNY